MVCTAVYKNTRLRTTTNLYIIALAISDLMSGVFVMPFALGVLIKGEWVYGRPSDLQLSSVHFYVCGVRFTCHYGFNSIFKSSYIC